MLNPFLVLEEARERGWTRLSAGRLKSICRWGWRLTLRPVHTALLRLQAQKQGLTLPTGWEHSHLMVRMVLRAYEKETASLIRETIQPGSNVIDVGAHIGYFTRLFSEIVGPSGRVFAFEPHPTNFSLLEKNTASCQNVHRENKAVSNTEGSARLYVSAYTCSHSLVFMEESAVQTEIEVEAITLDAFWEQHQRFPVHLIKVDVEGAELSVLEGAENLIRENQDLKIIAEFCPECLHSAGVTPQAFLEQLRGYGFRLLAILEEGLADIQQVNMEGKKYVNLLCLK